MQAVHLAQQEGIIPAHAGFTTPPPASFVASEDHPRTRGVYPFTPSHSPSPHWIIPAHAGFTSRVSSRGSRSPDHPRTRGVYHRQFVARPGARGSSPHTRGLPSVDPDPANGSGIIPAHAGFTVVDGGSPAMSRDHPRTRGVYLLEAQGGAGGLRIIPAHAGFTRHTRPRPDARPDHPRTRGVYFAVRAMHPSVPGSSPHTRGLPLLP